MGDEFQVMQNLLENPKMMFQVVSLIVAGNALGAVANRLSHRLIDGAKTASAASVQILFWTFEKRRKVRG